MFMRHEINSVMELIPESLRVAMKAHFASQYKEAKSLFVTRIGDSQWAKRELKNMSHSKSTQSNNFYIQQDAMKSKLSTKHQLAVKGLSECKASESNIRRIQVRDIVKEVEDHLKTYSSAGMDISWYVEGIR
ncbi:hypothetical protein Tco_1346252 [Tanacetum coccineum]